MKAPGIKKTVLPAGQMLIFLKKELEEAHKAGQTLKEEGYTFDIAYTSVLKRAIQNFMDYS